MKKLICIILSAFLIFTSACANTSSTSIQLPDEDIPSNEAFDEFMNSWFIENVQSDTLSLHYTLSDPASYRINDYPVTLGYISGAGFKNSFQKLRDLKASLQTFDYEKLNDSEKLTYDIFMDYIDTELSSENLYHFKTAIGPVTGIPAQYPILLSEYAFNSKKDIDDYLELLGELTPLFESIISFETEKISEGLGVNDKLIDENINICDTYLDNSENNIMFSTFIERINNLDFLTPDEKQAYIAANNEAVNTCFFSAYTYLKNSLNTLKGQGHNDCGLCWYPKGKDYYDYLVKSKACSSFDTDTLLSLIEAQIDSQLLQLSALVTADKSIIDDWGSFSFSLNDPAEILLDLKNKTKACYPDISETGCTIKRVSTALEPILSPAFYLTPPLDKANDNTIYINNGRISTINESLYPTLAHEGFPGHLYQTVYYLNTCPNMSRLLLNFKGYTEGWATYSEYEAYTLADSTTPRLAEAKMLNSEIVLGVYAMLDININYNYYTVADSKRLIEKYFTSISDESAETIFNAIVNEPSNYLSYYSGYLEISLMKQEAIDTLGDAFDPMAFHKFILDTGECSFRVLRNRFIEWLS